jgi:flavorubredoxin
MTTPTTKEEENDAAVEFMSIISPLLQKAAELGIVDADTTEFTDGFQALVNEKAYSADIQLHAAAMLVINKWIRRTNQSVPDNLKIELVLLMHGMLLDGRMKSLEDQYSSLLEELERKGVLVKKE